VRRTVRAADPITGGHTGRVRVLAVDWSGAVANARAGIRVAEARDGRLVSVRGDLDRDGVADHVLALADRGPVTVGIDFSFALPAWFARERGCDDVDALWSLVAEEGEGWLRTEPPPFWGRTTRRPPADPRRPPFRETEEHVRSLGLAPKSTFQIGGAGAVGTGSLRGMPHLARLRAAGVAVWPFDAAGEATVVEVYPSVWTSGARRLPVTRRAVAAQDPRVAPDLRDAVAASEHAFDAAVTALAMAAHDDELRTLPAGSGAQAIEGSLWLPEALRARESCASS
jgi:hypothetical protein